MQLLGVIHFAGIESNVPGYNKNTTKPDICDRSITRLKTIYNSINEQVVSSWGIEYSIFYLDVTIPVNTVASIYIPKLSCETSIEISIPSDIENRAKLIKTEQGFDVYSIGSGPYSFQSKIYI